jgi:hypothetical protein
MKGLEAISLYGFALAAAGTFRNRKQGHSANAWGLKSG